MGLLCKYPFFDYGINFNFNIMKKILLSMSLLLIAMTSLNAQAIYKGDKVVTLGIGLSSYYTGDGYNSSFIPLNASFEYCVVDNLIDGNAAIGVGGYLGYAADQWKAYDIKRSHTIFGAKGYFHYNFARDLDTYGGLMLGYNVINTTTSSTHPYTGKSSGVTYSLFLGARYYFADNIGAFLELGYGVAALELGVAFRF